MNLKVINSNSLGNAYLLTSSTGEVLMIECGVQFDKIKKALNFKTGNVVGCILTHEHGDHAKSIKDVIKAGINVWASAGTHTACGTVMSHRAKITFAGDHFKCGSFSVKPFKTEHDVKEPLGFLIHHPECGVVLFLTDSYYCQYTFKGLNNIIIESNYCQKIIDRRMAEGENPRFLRDRVITSHMSLSTCKGFLKANDLSNVNNIVLIHLSDSNSDAPRFQKEVTEITGKLVHVAEPGLQINFSKQPF